MGGTHRGLHYPGLPSSCKRPASLTLLGPKIRGCHDAEDLVSPRVNFRDMTTLFPPDLCPVSAWLWIPGSRGQGLGPVALLSHHWLHVACLAAKFVLSVKST